MKPSFFGEEFPTNIKKELLKEYVKASVFMPPNFTIHPRIHKYHI